MRGGIIEEERKESSGVSAHIPALVIVMFFFYVLPVDAADVESEQRMIATFTVTAGDKVAGRQCIVAVFDEVADDLSYKDFNITFPLLETYKPNLKVQIGKSSPIGPYSLRVYLRGEKNSLVPLEKLVTSFFEEQYGIHAVFSADWARPDKKGNKIVGKSFRLYPSDSFIPNFQSAVWQYDKRLLNFLSGLVDTLQESQYRNIRYVYPEDFMSYRNVMKSHFLSFDYDKPEIRISTHQGRDFDVGMLITWKRSQEDKVNEFTETLRKRMSQCDPYAIHAVEAATGSFAERMLQ